MALHLLIDFDDCYGSQPVASGCSSKQGFSGSDAAREAGGGTEGRELAVAGGGCSIRPTWEGGELARRGKGAISPNEGGVGGVDCA